jgi:hypothetical protein
MENRLISMTQPEESDFPTPPFNREGLTIRDYLAARAMQGLLANPTTGDSRPDWIARIAVVNADTLIAELNKGQKS